MSLAAMALAQSPELAFAPSDPLRASPVDGPARIPLHGGTDDPSGIVYGLWAATPSYKASFHDGFAFYPYIPEQDRSRALHWRLASATVGGTALDLATPVTWHDDYRLELRRGALVEAYDILEQGVEQTFVLHRAPATVGDLVITGAITTEFACAATDAAVQQLVFHHDGRAAVRYGQAMAFDASGRRWPVTTAFDGAQVTLRLAADAVAAAAYPLTVDPLVATVNAQALSGQPVVDTAIAAQQGQTFDNSLIACVRQFSASDRDAYALRRSTASGTATVIFSDVTTNWSTENIDCADMSGTQRWVIAFERLLPSGVNSVRIYSHQQANISANTGITLDVPNPALSEYLEPMVGGRVNDPQALVVCRSFGGLLSTSSPIGVIVNTTTHTLGTAFNLRGAAGSLGNAGSVEVTPTAQGSEPWRTIWTEEPFGSTTRTVRVGIVTPTGSVPAVVNLATGDNARQTKIAGSGDKYMATYVDSLGGSIPTSPLRKVRFDLDAAGALTSVQNTTQTTAAVFQTITNHDLTTSLPHTTHWAMTYLLVNAPLGGTTTRTAHVLRLGSTGGVVEAQVLGNAAGTDAPAVAFDGDVPAGTRHQFLTVHTVATSAALVTNRFTFAAAGGFNYGASCRTPTYFDGHPPYAGTSNYRFGVFLPAGTVALGAFGFSSAGVPLDALGAIGCNLLVNYNDVLTSVADGNGQATAVLNLPDNPLFLGDLYAQWFWFEAGANPLGLVSGHGTRIHIE